MAEWDDLYLDKNYIPLIPQIEIYKFCKKLDVSFNEKPLSIWDFCCGAGRHTIFMSKLGYNVYASDSSVNGINYLKQWLQHEKIKAEVSIKDMTESPWDNIKFHGIVCWNALHHNTLDNIMKAENVIYNHTLPGGLFILNLMSTKSDYYGHGIEIEKNTFISEEGDDSGVPHHYFDYDEIKSVFNKWTFLVLSEQVSNYIETEPEYYKTNPFSYTKWNLLLKKQ
ncbi:MAG: class I SAM-dependent methyltransferase [Spirochaetes bacterium]|nr:class I SAM-dependent methyltransferase [Spirochaetota bacterium]